jgi:hypothetical protein
MEIISDDKTTVASGAHKQAGLQMPRNRVAGILAVGLLAFGGLGLSIDVPSAHASFGSGGAAVFSPPVTPKLSLEEYLLLSPAKQRALEFTVNCNKDDKTCDTQATAQLRRKIEEFTKEIDKLQSRVVER